jgi:hypothetical protein
MLPPGLSTRSTTGRLAAFENLAGRHHDADPRVGPGLEHTLGPDRGQILIHLDRVERVILAVLPHEVFQFVSHFAAALERGHQTTLQRQLRGIAVQRAERRRTLRDVVIQRGGGQRAGVRDVALIGTPQARQPRRAFIALGRRHVAARKLIRVTLEGAGTKDVHVHAQFIDRILEEHPVVAEAVDVDQAQGIQVHLAGLGRDVVAGLIERIGGHDDAFAARAKLAYRFADLLQLGQARRLQIPEIEHDQLDARVAPGRLDRIDDVFQQRFRRGTTGCLAHGAPHRVAR